MTRLVIVGAGGHAKEVASYLGDVPDVELVGFLDENRPPGPFCGARVLGGFAALDGLGVALAYLTAVGNNDVRRRFVDALGARAAAWSLIHPRATVGRNVEIGAGTLLAPGAVVTTETRIGRHCILNIKASVSHDCEIGDFTNINPGATVCGTARIGAGCFIGAGATVIERITIGDGTIVGAGAVVTRDLPPQVTAVGVPARVIKRRAT